MQQFQTEKKDLVKVIACTNDSRTFKALKQ